MSGNLAKIPNMVNEIAWSFGLVFQQNNGLQYNYKPKIILNLAAVYKHAS